MGSLTQGSLLGAPQTWILSLGFGGGGILFGATPAHTEYSSDSSSALVEEACYIANALHRHAQLLG